MKKRNILIGILSLGFLYQLIGYCCADVLTINIPNTYGVQDAIITLDCYIGCGDLDSANFYISFDPSEISLCGIYQNNILDIQYQSGFRILSNISNDIALLNEKGVVGIVIFDERGSAAKDYFRTPKCLFTVMFKVMKDNASSFSIDCSGAGMLRTAVLSSDLSGTWQTAEESGTIMLLKDAGLEPTFNIPVQTKSIEEEAFAQSGVRTLIASEGLEAIEERAFADCLLLRDAYLPKTLASIAEDAFSNCPGLIIHCASGSWAEEYAKAHRIPYLITID